MRMCVVSNTVLCYYNIILQEMQQKIDELVKRAEKKQGETFECKCVISRLTIVSREAKKKQRPLSELFTWTTTKKLRNAQAKPP